MKWKGVSANLLNHWIMSKFAGREKNTSGRIWSYRNFGGSPWALARAVEQEVGQAGLSRGPARTAEAGRSLLRELARRQRDHEWAPDLGRCRGGPGRGQWQRRDLRARQGRTRGARTREAGRLGGWIRSREVTEVPFPAGSKQRRAGGLGAPWRGDAAAMQREREM